MALLVLAFATLSIKWASAGENAKPRFIASGMVVKDTASGLAWTRNGNPAGHTLSWHDAIRFVSILNKQKYGGHSDWRLPASHELKKLSSAIRKNGNTAFHDVQEGDYWSSSTSIFNNVEALSINMISGVELISNKSLYMFVWPVRWEGKKKKADPAGSPSSRPAGT